MVSSISRTIQAPPPRPTAPDYHHYVTSMLHRRWMRVLAMVLSVCYVEAWLVTSKRAIFWSLLSAAPAKAVLLWISMLPVLIMRIQMIHLGSAVRPSAAADFQHFLGSFKTYATALSYMFSAYVFVILYMVTSGDRDQLGITVEARSYERPRLNERFLYLIFLAIWAGLVNTFSHLTSDRDRIVLPGVSIQPKITSEEGTQGGKKTNILMEVITKQGNLIAVRVFNKSAITTITGMFGYLPIRGSLWRYTLRITRIFYRISNSPIPYNWPVGFFFFFRTFWISCLIFGLWEIAHSAFNIYFSMEPLKEGKPLSESSVDPNGTLITGFKHTRKPFTRSCAFWELVWITFNKTERRRSFFTDIDRPIRVIDEIIKECLIVLDQANSSLQQKDQPPPPPPPSSAITLFELASPNKRLPMQSIKESNDVFLDPSSSKSIPEAIRSWQSKDGVVLGETVSARLQPFTPDMSAKRQQVRQELNSVGRKFIESTAGKPFRQTVERKTLGLIPNVRLQMDAVAALTKLLICALTEDEFGSVQKNVGSVLEKFYDSMDTLEAYIEAPGIHWTDTESEGSEGSEIIKAKLKEPKELLDFLRKGARDVVVAYRPYLSDLNLSVKVAKRTRQVLESPVE